MGCCQDTPTSTTATQSTAATVSDSCCGEGAQGADTCCATSTSA